MDEAIPPACRRDLRFRPRIHTIKINPEKIRDVIGKGGSVIRALTEETGTNIELDDDGTVDCCRGWQKPPWKRSVASKP